MKSIQQLDDIEDKIVLLRLDLNVPILKGKITDANRVDKIIPTLKFLISKKAKIVIISHIGRPKGKVVEHLSLMPVGKILELKIKKKVSLFKKNIFNLKKKEILNSNRDEIVLLENIRFYQEEESNDENFAKKLASLGEIYINDAFSCSHRNHASVSKITKYIPSYGGIQINTEVNALKKLLKK